MLISKRSVYVKGDMTGLVGLNLFRKNRVFFCFYCKYPYKAFTLKRNSFVVSYVTV